MGWEEEVVRFLKLVKGVGVDRVGVPLSHILLQESRGIYLQTSLFLE